MSGLGRRASSAAGITKWPKCSRTSRKGPPSSCGSWNPFRPDSVIMTIISPFFLKMIRLHLSFSPTANIGPRTNPGQTGKKSYGSGKETLRLRANGPARVEEAVSAIGKKKQIFLKKVFFSLTYSAYLCGFPGSHDPRLTKSASFHPIYFISTIAGQCGGSGRG